MKKIFFILLTSYSICSIWSCTSMRWEYGFNPRNRTIYSIEKTIDEVGRVKIKRREKNVYPKGVLDAAVYEKIRVKRFDKNGKMKSDSIKERICSVWGYDHTVIRYKLYSDTGKVKKGKYEVSQPCW